MLVYPLGHVVYLATGYWPPNSASYGFHPVEHLVLFV